MSNKISCSTLVESEMGILLVGQETEGEMLFSLPGGKPKSKETLPNAAIRETLEETGIEVVIPDIVVIQHVPRSRAGNTIIRVVFRGEEVGGGLTLHKDHPIVGYFPFKEIKAMRKEGSLKLNGTYEAVKGYRDGAYCNLSVLESLKKYKPPKSKRLEISA